ncbi:MAG: hypothetical protein H6738_20875 [Alphaproteobacteria bacterium]|nr:hypothetical protein [Alphaproteobacteria bacterium]MCB9699247.1 hypothetical protein [Alphaproteobacteria bacterium]
MVVLLLVLGCRSEQAPVAAASVDSDDPSATADDLAITGHSQASWGRWHSGADPSAHSGSGGGHTGLVDTTEESVPRTAHTGGTDTGAVAIAAQLSCSRVADPALVAACGANAAALVGGTAYASVGAAIAAVAPGGRVDVCPGTWTESLTPGKSLSLVGVDPRPGATVLSGGGRSRVLTLGADQVTLDGLTVRDGYDASEGGGVYAAGTTLDLRCVVFEDNVSDLEGGAIEVFEGVATATGCTFLRNHAGSNGGALQLEGWQPSGMEIVDSVFDGNSADGGGGAIHVGSWAHDRLRLVDTDLLRNTARSGGALRADSWNQVTIEVQRGRISGNLAVSDGGGISLSSDLAANVTLSGTTLDDNRAVFGAALLVSSRVTGGTVLLDGVSVLANQAGPGSAALLVDSTTAVLRCVGCDLGAGPTDNAPMDTMGYGQVVNGGAGTSFRLP